MRKFRVFGVLVVAAGLWLGVTPAPAGEEPGVWVEDTIYGWESEPTDGSRSMTAVGYTSLRIPINLSTPWTTDIVVEHVTRDGTAVAQQDYVGGNGRTVVYKGQTAGYAEVLIVDDDRCEKEEYFTFVLTKTSVGTIRNAVAKVVIRDDDC
jgi:hypothetical protein